MTLANSMRLLSAAAFATLIATPAISDTVTIQTNDGKVNFVGQVLTVVDRTMTVQTNVGPITFNVDAVSCQGFGCPTLPLDNVQRTAG